jgi:hypothetical protein
MKKFGFWQQFCNQGHDESEVPNETMIKLQLECLSGFFNSNMLKMAIIS